MLTKCSNCNKKVIKKPSIIKRYKRVFCNQKCYSEFRKTKLPFQEQFAYRGIRKIGENKQVYYKRYAKLHPERIAHLKARRYAREKYAKGSHTLEDWQKLCKKFNYKCAKCGENKKLTKDHIKPLSLGGTDFIKNIQPLCRNCNSRKWKTFNIYENPNLLIK